MESWFPNLLTLIVGIAVGFALGYLVFGRRSGSASLSAASRNADKSLKRLYDESPRFFAAVRDDLTRPEFSQVREFAIVASSDITFVSEELRFVYYEDEVPNLRNLAQELEENGFVDDVTSGRTPIFRMRDNFIQVLDSL